MPMLRLEFRGGIDTEKTPTANRGGWSTSSLVRFREGLLERIMGWTRVCNTALAGVCRAIHYWTDLLANPYFACGTNTNLYVVENGTRYDITPTSGFTPGSVSSGSVPYSLLVWALDNFGQDLIAVPSGQGIFLWTPTSPPTGRATQISQAPPHNQGAFMVMPAQILMAFGSAPDAGALDPMLIRWCDQSDFTDWTPTTTNQAGSFRLSRGNRIIGAIQAPVGAMILTDTDIWSVTYIGFPLVFGFFIVGSNCGLISEHALSVMGGILYWMSDHGFFRLTSAGPQQIPCTVWDQVFLNLDEANEDKCLAAANYHYSEVIFFYPSLAGGSGEIDSYAKYNVVENLWDYGPATPEMANAMARTAWTDQNRPGPPVSVDLSGFLEQQETGLDAAGAALTGVTARSGYLDITNGHDEIFCSRYVPDFIWQGENPSIEVTLYFRRWPGDTPSVQGPFVVTPSTEYLSFRVRGREVAEQIDCNAAGTWFRRGVPRLLVQPDGQVY